MPRSQLVKCTRKAVTFSTKLKYACSLMLSKKQINFLKKYYVPPPASQMFTKIKPLLLDGALSM